MAKLKPATPQEAQEVWRKIRRPSARRVARALTQAGRPVHFATVARWKAQNWRPVPERLDPLQAAQDELDVAAPVLTGDPATNTAAVVEGSEAAKKLEDLSDEQLVSKAVRDSLIGLHALFGETCRHRARLIGKQPG
jgi:hypothetical protein